MRRFGFSAAATLVMLGACGSSDPAEPRELAVLTRFSVAMDTLSVEEHKYVDGIAVFVDGGRAVLLTEESLDACLKLAIAGTDSAEFELLAQDGKQGIRLVRDNAHLDGAVLEVGLGGDRIVTKTFPEFPTEGTSFEFEGDVGDAGGGTIDATRYGRENAPLLSLDVDLPFVSVPPPNPAAEASAEAGWLRDTQKYILATSDRHSALADSLEAHPGDSDSKYNWSDMIRNWKELKVVAVARDSSCATLVLHALDASDQPVQGVVRLRGDGDARKVVSVATRKRAHE